MPLHPLDPPALVVSEHSQPAEPAALAGLLAEGRGWAVRHEGEDGTFVECFTVEDDGRALRIYRRVWWHDPGRNAWDTDPCEVWEIDSLGVDTLRRLLGEVRREGGD